MSFITIADLKLVLGIEDTEQDVLLQSLVDSVQSLWNTLTNKIWEQITHTQYCTATKISDCPAIPESSFYGISNAEIECEYISRIFLDDYPISDVNQVASGKQAALQVYNSNEYSTATVKVTSTGIIVTYNSVADSTVLFATYATISDVVTAINALGSGWTADVMSNYGSWQSSNLLPMFAKNCIDSNQVDLNIPAYFYDIYNIDEETGIVDGSFPLGMKNVYVTYTSGYADADCPAWLKNALVNQAAYWFMEIKDKGWAVNKEDEAGDGGSQTFIKDQMTGNLLPEFEMLVDFHRKQNV